MMSQSLLDILCCPETHQALEVAEPALIQAINERIAQGRQQNRAGQLLQEKIDSGLLRADKKYLYPVRQGVPIMLIDEALPLES